MEGSKYSFWNLATCHAEYVSMFYSIRLENNVDSDQLTLLEASWSGATVFLKEDKSGFSMDKD